VIVRVSPLVWSQGGRGRGRGFDLRLEDLRSRFRGSH
jgi:hypothetical protein